MAADITLLEGSVKFRDNKKWKSRWCVLRKLSPVADCIQLELYREASGTRGGAREGPPVAALALSRFVGAEAGFTLDKHSHTLALLCTDLVLVLAFHSRETLMQWQVKISSNLGESSQFPVVVMEGGAVAAGAARLHVGSARAALSAGTPPRLLAHWPLQHLRRFGVYEGKFCMEGGALSGKEGLVAMRAERPHELERELRAAAARKAATPQDPDSPKSHKRPDSRLSEINTISRSLTSTEGLYSEGWAKENMGLPSKGSGEVEGSCVAGRGTGALQRCVSCMSSLRALSGAPPPPPRAFRPAWSMRAAVTHAPRPRHLAPANHWLAASAYDYPPIHATDSYSKIGPYENYDVPRIPSFDVEGEYYDTPRRLHERLEGNMTVPRSMTTSDLILQNRCGCIRRVTTMDSCRCDRRIPPNELYASVDLSQKSKKRKAAPAYENLEFALSLKHYENAKDIGARVPPAAADYLVMCPRPQDSGGYARMVPRAASNPALAEDAPPPARRRAASADSGREPPTATSLSSTETLRGGGAGAAGARRAGGAVPGNRDSSSSNDSGVCTWRPPRRRARSTDPPAAHRLTTSKSASAEAEVPVLSLRTRKGTVDAHSTSSGTSDLSDYIETLSICSSHSSSDTPVTMRERCTNGCVVRRECAAVLRPRSGAEYRRLLPSHTHTYTHTYTHTLPL